MRQLRRSKNKSESPAGVSAPDLSDFENILGVEDETLEFLSVVEFDRLKEFYRNTRPPTLAELRKQRQVWRGQPGCSQSDPGVEADIAFIAEWQALYDERHDDTEYDF